MSGVFQWISQELKGLVESGLKRELETRPGNCARYEKAGKTFLNFAGNDYLGLAGDEGIRLAIVDAAERFGSGSGASRLLSGNFPLHLELENALAESLGTESALVFSSGYLANIAAVSSLVGRGDVVISDKFSHASLLDGIQLSRAKHLRYFHNDCKHLEYLLRNLGATRRAEQRVLIVTESLFSMDGDFAPVEQLAHLAEEHGAMILVDESHSFGIFGEQGGGFLRSLGITSENLFITGSFGKSLASSGGYVAGSRELREYLLTSARTFIFNTAPSPTQLAAARGALRLFPAAERRTRLRQYSVAFRKILSSEGIEALGDVRSPIVPVLAPGNGTCLQVQKGLLEQGIHVAAIRSPTVPRDFERIRVSLSAAHTAEEVEMCAQVLSEKVREAC